MGVDKIVPTYRLAMGTAGSARISHERIRQIEEEGIELDDDMVQPDLLLQAAESYLHYARGQVVSGDLLLEHRKDPSFWHWPWSDESWKPAANPGRNLEKAGALIAAALDVAIRVTELTGEELKAVVDLVGEGVHGDQSQQSE